MALQFFANLALGKCSELLKIYSKLPFQIAINTIYTKLKTAPVKHRAIQMLINAMLVMSWRLIESLENYCSINVVFW